MSQQQQEPSPTPSPFSIWCENCLVKEAETVCACRCAIIGTPHLFSTDPLLSALLSSSLSFLFSLSDNLQLLHFLFMLSLCSSQLFKYNDSIRSFPNAFPSVVGLLLFGWGSENPLTSRCFATAPAFWLLSCVRSSTLCHNNRVHPILLLQEREWRTEAEGKEEEV
mmetsp:Transcript_22772/g.31238  ORF Transcript_22772/g.31238 Transcript_22772/m.31238 type:complete len:166 (-) Transcript_22772:136-633(-)